MKFDLPKCTLESGRGGDYQLHVSDLSPTQNAVGMDEVKTKTKRIRRRNKKELKHYLYLRPVPVVIGQDKFFLIDRHHMSRSLWEAAGKDNDSGLKRKNVRVVVRVVENWQFIRSPNQFWRAMDKKHWVYPYDHGGGGPLNVKRLKKHVEDLENDPYRSLAWYVRQRFGYFKDPSNPIFAEFKWANFFRTRVELGDEMFDPESGVDLEEVLIEKLDQDDKDEVVAYALALARSNQARGLPGYAGS